MEGKIARPGGGGGVFYSWLKPWCMDDRELNPGAVLRVVKATGTDADDGDDAEWGRM